MAHEVFISHSTKDKSVADAVCAALESAAIRCWIAPRDVQPGRSFAGEIKRAIENSKTMVLIFSAHSNNSEQVLREVQLAVNAHLHLVQFRIEDVILNDDLSYFLSTPHWLDALTPPLEGHLDRLTVSIKTLLASPTGGTAQKMAEGVRLSGNSMDRGTASRDRGASPGPAWRGDVSSVLKKWRLLVLILAAFFSLLGSWWFYRAARETSSREMAQKIPSPAPSATSERKTEPAAAEFREENQADAPNTTQQMPAIPDWAAAQMVPTVAPQNEVPIRRRFILQHEERVEDATFSPDGKRIVTASDDGTGRIWDAETGKAMGEPLRHEGSRVTTAHFSPDGKQIVTASDDNTARIWDAETGKPLGAPLQHDGTVTSANFSPDGERIVTGTYQGTARVWDVETGEPLSALMRHQSQINTAVFSSDGKRVLTSSDDNTARIWDSESGSPIGDLLRHKGGVSAACFDPDGKRVATISGDNNPRVWDAQTSEKLFELETSYTVNSICFSPDGKRLVTAANDHTARIWDAETGKLQGQPLRHDGDVAMATFSPNSKRVATASIDRTARLWDAQTNQPLSKPLEHDGYVKSAHFSPDGKQIVTGSEDHTARLWEIGDR